MASFAQNKMYTQVPTIQYNRSRFNLSHHHKGTANLGEIKPCLLKEVYPGDTFNVKTNFQVRLNNSLARPLMDNMFIDYYYFFVPMRLCYDKWEQVMGENDETSAYVPLTKYKMPVTEGPSVVSVGSLADSFGLPVGEIPAGINIAPFRAYAQIYQHWFRDQNSIDPIFIQKGDIAETEVFNNEPFSPNNYMGKCAIAAKLHDRFTSALPNPQKGEPVLVRLNIDDFKLDTAMNPYEFESGQNLSFVYDMGNIPSGNSLNFALGSNISHVAGSSNPVADVRLIDSAESTNNSTGVQGTNLVGNVSGAGITVNDLRLAFATQRMLEKDSVWGSRYKEILASHWSVKSPDSRLQIPEFLGGKRETLDIGEVWQTSGAESFSGEFGLSNLLGSSAAYLKSSGDAGFSKAFVEHGYVIGVYVIRQHHNYSQGIEKFWTRSERLDYYDPSFAHIGFQPIYTSELYGLTNGDPNYTLKSNVFGYTEAWYDLRTSVNQVTGYLRPEAGAGTGLDLFTLADVYDGPPVLGEEFINETPAYLDRSLLIKSEFLDQFMLDVYHTISAIRVLPTYSTPTDLGGGHR